MAIDIHLIRHAETEANRDGLWQGHGDSPLSDAGTEQAAALGTRLVGREFDLVVSSDLARASTTAGQFSGSAVLDPIWRETDIGLWEGLTRREVAARFGDEVSALMAGQPTRFGGGESVAEFEARMDEALDTLVARMEDGQSAAVVTHGGIIGGLIARVLGLRGGRPRPFTRLSNTSLTTIRVDGDHQELASFNDADHVSGPRHAGIVLIRHGETEANIAGVWQGVSNGSLSETGRRQAKLLAERAEVDVVYSSPLTRARDTAAAIAERHAVGHHIEDSLREMDFGEWEDLHPSQIMNQWPDEFRRAYLEDEDLPRGSTGETYGSVSKRMRQAIDQLAELHAGSLVGLVSHGTAIRAYLSDVVGLGYAGRRRLASLGNTGISRIEFGEHGAVVASFNNTPHLEG